MTLLTPLARKVAEISNVILPSSRPYVGYSAFAHKGGMHIDGMAKLEGAFEHIAPEKVGNSRRILMSEVAGKSMMLNRLRKIDPKIADNPKQVERITARLKELEFQGYQFESAEESFQLEVRRLLGIQKEFFELEYFRIISEPAHMTECSASAVIKVKVGENSEVTAAEGEGPVNALDLALRKALATFYPELEDVRLTDYKVRVLESDATTAAKVRVLIESTDSNRTWTTVGVSSDIIEASFLALTDAIEYKLTLSEMEKEGGN